MYQGRSLQTHFLKHCFIVLLRAADTPRCSGRTLSYLRQVRRRAGCPCGQIVCSCTPYAQLYPDRESPPQESVCGSPAGVSPCSSGCAPPRPSVRPVPLSIARAVSSRSPVSAVLYPPNRRNKNSTTGAPPEVCPIHAAVHVRTEQPTDLCRIYPCNRRYS